MRPTLRVAMILCLSGALRAQSPDDLTAFESRADNQSLSIREREQAADRAAEIRRALIDAAPPAEPRLTGWLIDQAAASLARLGRDGSDSAALFGLPLPSQRDSALKAATEAAADLRRAADLADAAARALAAQGLPAEDPRVAAVEQHRAVRIPYFRARALTILAALSPAPDRIAHARAAHAAIARLILATTGPEASRRVSLAAALLLRTDPPDPADARTAVDELAWIIRAAAEPGARIPITVRAEAWLGLTHAGAAAGRLDQTLEGLDLALKQDPFTRDGRADPLLMVLAADAATRVLWQHGARERSPSLLARAAAAQTALLARHDLGLRPETLRPIAFEKLAALAAESGDITDLPPLPPAARLGLAIATARDPARRAKAMTELAALADLPDAPDIAPEALWERSVLLTQSQAAADRAAAVESLTRLARQFPDHPRAPEAMSAALAYGRTLGDADGAGREADPYLAALALATASYTSLPDIDLWRYEHARLLTSAHEPVPEHLDQALNLLDLIPRGSTLAPDADRLQHRTLTAAIDHAARHIADLRRAGEDQSATTFARDRAVPLARRARDWARTRPDPHRFRLDLADALVEAVDPSAAALHREALAAEAGPTNPAPSASPSLPPSPPADPIRIRLGLARALLAAGDPRAAFPYLRDVAAWSDAAPRPPAFWHAWALMLETLLREDTDQTRRGPIRANIKRLESLDPELGGDPWKSRIARVRDAVAQ